MLSSISKLSFLGANQRRLLQQGVSVFTYHKLAPPNANTRDPFLYVSPRRFDEQLAKLKEHGYQSGTLDDVKSGLDTKSKLKAIITFDDGFCSVLENGLKVLARHRFQAIQFIVAGSLGGRNDWDVAKKDVSEPLMDEVQIKEWLAAGHEI